MKGHLSPWSKLTLKPEERRAANIPDTAVNFAWVYPIPSSKDDGVAAAMIQRESTNQVTMKSLRRWGGFVYCDSSCAIVRVFAAVPVQHSRRNLRECGFLGFRPPRPMLGNLLAALQRMPDPLHAAPPALRAGSLSELHFGWVPPPAPSEWGLHQEIGDLGGFVFTLGGRLPESTELSLAA